jgi:hypothetical protein
MAYTVFWLTYFHLDIPKIDNGEIQKWKLDKSISDIEQWH